MDSLSSSETFESFFTWIKERGGSRQSLSADCLKGEPSLDELLDEPIARLLMACDKVDPNVLEELVRRRFA